MQKVVLQTGRDQLDFLKKFGFEVDRSTDGIGYIRFTNFGYQAISFFERFIDQPELYCTISIRLDKVENVSNFYKIKYRLTQIEYAEQTPTIAVGLENIIGRDIKFWTNQNLQEQFESIFTENALPFFEEYSSLSGCLKAINNDQLMNYIEPIRTYSKLILTALNDQNTSEIFSRWENLNPENGMVQMYRPVFEDIKSQLNQGLALESL